jgi:ATP-binding cassette subfamily F protein 3
MIQVHGISIKFGDRVLLGGISFVLKKTERIGLIGRNGAGKSTLLKVLAKKLTPDAGSIQAPNNTSVGYLEQEIDFQENRSIIDETLTCFKELQSMEKRILEIGIELESREDYESEEYLELIQDLSHLTERLGILDSGNIEGEAVKVLKGLGFDEKELKNSVQTLSGGWKMRVELAKLLLQEPDLLLLDEPTNHLDIESIIWLEEYLSGYPGTVLLISHDTRFLENTVNRVIEIELGRITDIKGSFSHFQIEKEKQKGILESSYVNQQKLIAQKERTITRFMAKASKTSMAQSMQKQLNKIDRIEIPQEDMSEMRIRFSNIPRSSRVLLKGNDIHKSFGDKNVIKGVDFQVERGDRIAFVGQNGQGKSTLAKILVGNLEVSDGVLEEGENIYLSYYAQNETDSLDGKLTVLDTAEQNAPPEMRTKVRNILGSFLFSGDDAEKKVSVLSGGEKSRLSLACKMMHPSNLVILDEPTNHLDIKAKEVLKNALLDYTGTLIVVSHDRYFLSGLTDKVFEFRDHNIKEYLGDIDYYLEKRKVDDIRLIEIQNQKEPNKEKPKSTISNSHKKEIEKKIKYTERDIEKIENSIKNLSLEINNITDYSDEHYIKLSKQLTSNQSLLLEKESQWEKLVESLEL